MIDIFRPNISLLVFCICLAFSCSTNKNVVDLERNNDTLLIARTDTINMLNNRNDFVSKKFASMNSGIQILRIVSDQGYDFEESIDLFYSENDKILVLTSENVKLTNFSFENLESSLSKVQKGSVVVTDERRSSRHIIQTLFLKYEGKIYSSLVLSGVNINAIKNNNMLKNEYELFKNFIIKN